MPNKSKMNGSTEDWSLLSWEMLVPKAKLSPDKRHLFLKLKDCGIVSHVRLTIYPDGGVSRMRCWGVPALLNHSKL